MNQSFPPSTNARIIEASPLLIRLSSPPRWKEALFSLKTIFIVGLLLGFGIGSFSISYPVFTPKEKSTRVEKAGPRVHLPTEKKSAP